MTASLSSLDPDAGLSGELKIPSLPELTYLLQEEEEEQRVFCDQSLSPAAQEKFFLPAQSHLFLVGRRRKRGSQKSPFLIQHCLLPLSPLPPRGGERLESSTMLVRMSREATKKRPLPPFSEPLFLHTRRLSSSPSSTAEGGVG